MGKPVSLIDFLDAPPLGTKYEREVHGKKFTAELVEVREAEGAGSPYLVWRGRCVTCREAMEPQTTTLKRARGLRANCRSCLVDLARSGKITGPLARNILKSTGPLARNILKSTKAEPAKASLEVEALRERLQYLEAVVAKLVTRDPSLSPDLDDDVFA